MATLTNSGVVLVPAAEESETNMVVPESLREVKPPVEVGGGWWPWVLVVVAIGLLLAWWMRSKRRRGAAAPGLVVVPPHRRAKDRLQAALDSLHDAKLFMTRVSGALRVYLEERFELRAPERTTEEFLEELQGSSVLSGRQKELLADFLGRSDLVKFAGFEPSEDELRGLWDVAMDLVEETGLGVAEDGRVQGEGRK
jgi:hypothetical protein